MRALLLTIELLQPVLATGLEGEPNSASTQLYLPGSLLRGAAIANCLHKDGKRDLDQLAEPERSLVWQRFFSNRIRFLHGYPAIGQEKRSLPVPLHWRRWKTLDQDSVFEAEQEFAPGFNPYQNPAGDLPRRFFGNYTCYAPVDLPPVPQHLRVHTSINADYGYAVGEEATSGPSGGIFRYVALAAGQSFVAPVLLCAGSEEDALADGEWLKPLLEGRQRLGRARTSGGEVRIDITSPGDWKEVLTNQVDLPAPIEKFRLTLLSDALIRGRDGQYQASLDAAEIEAALGENARVAAIEPVAVATTVTGGFNRKWNLPLPQAAAIAMGSSFDITLGGCINRAQIGQLTDRGLGERRNEGYGRIAAGLKTPSKYRPVAAWQPAETKDANAASTLSPAQQELLNLVGERLCRPAVDEAIERGAAFLQPAGQKPSRSAVSRLAAAAQRARELAETGEPQAALDFWTQMLSQAHGPFRRQIDGAQVTGLDRKPVSLRQWLGRFESESSFDTLLPEVKKQLERLGEAGANPTLNHAALQFRLLTRALGLLRKQLQREEA